MCLFIITTILKIMIIANIIILYQQLKAWYPDTDFIWKFLGGW